MGCHFLGVKTLNTSLMRQPVQQFGSEAVEETFQQLTTLIHSIE